MRVIEISLLKCVPERIRTRGRALPVTGMVPVGVNLPLIPEIRRSGLQMVSIGLVRMNSTVIDAFEHGTAPDCEMVPD